MEHNFEVALDNIIQLAKQNPEFNRELRKRLQTASSANVVSNGSSVTEDVAAIRAALEIRANTSINYAFVKEQRLWDQLIVDNLRMENASINLKDDEDHRFYIFCVNAFYQVENIINYFFYKKYPVINDLLNEIERATSLEKYPFKRKGNEKNVGDITIVNKINAFCNISFPNEKSFKINLNAIRMVRNEGAHRCMIIKKNAKDSSFLHQFLTQHTFNSIRIIIKKLVRSIESQLSTVKASSLNKLNISKKEKDKNEVKGEKDNLHTVSAQISSMLPSSCFVKYGDQTEQIPPQLFKQIMHLKTGDMINLSIKNKKIINVITDCAN